MKMMHNILITKCTDDKIKAAAAFYEAAVQHMVETDTNYPKWTKDYPNENSVRLAVEGGSQYICTLEGAIVGAFVLNEDPAGAYEKGDWLADIPQGQYLVIHTLAVAYELSGRGIGGKMVRFCLDYARQNGYRAVRIDVVPTNFPAANLYKKYGFTFAGEKDLDRKISDIPTFYLYEYNF